MLTRKHFEALAAIVAAHNSLAKRRKLAANTLRYLRNQGNLNPRFDRERFLTACGI